MARQVETELGDLKMSKARFGVMVDQRNDPEGAYLPTGNRVAFDSTGIDQVEFMISANPGEPLKPLAKVASGGETARIMLALKGVLTHADATPTLIFDEIDQGIGGRVGSVVGQKLWMLTGQPMVENPQSAVVAHQVLCITHLPQLAAFGDSHFTVNKEVVAVKGEERTSTAGRKGRGKERGIEVERNGRVEISGTRCRPARGLGCCASDPLTRLPVFRQVLPYFEQITTMQDRADVIATRLTPTAEPVF